MTEVVSMARTSEYWISRSRKHRLAGRYDEAMALLAKTREQYGRGEALERERADDTVGFAGRNRPFERPAQGEAVVPLLRREITVSLADDLPPERHEVIAQNRFSRFFALFIDREDEVQVGVRQTGDLPAVGTFAARITVAAVRTVEALYISQCQRKSPGSGTSREELGMAHPSGIDPAHQMTFQLPLTDDLRKPHFTPCSAASAGAAAGPRCIASPPEPVPASACDRGRVPTKGP